MAATGADLTERQTRSWRNDGFLIVRELFPRQVRDQILGAIFAQFRKYAPQLAAFECDGPPWLDSAFHGGMVQLRGTNSQAFGRLYDSLQTNVLVQAELKGPRVRSIASALLGDPPETLSTTGAMLRLDTPGDTRNVLDWHQERSYYPQNDDGLNGLFVWVPLQDVTLDTGTIFICPGSHREGFIKVVTSGKAEHITSEQNRVPRNRLDRYKAVPVLAAAGDALFSSMNLFHSSGPNTSDRIRFTLVVRYHRAIAEDFMPGRELFVPSP